MTLPHCHLLPCLSPPITGDLIPFLFPFLLTPAPAYFSPVPSLAAVPTPSADSLTESFSLRLSVASGELPSQSMLTHAAFQCYTHTP